MGADRVHGAGGSAGVLALSFAPLLFKAVDYALLGGFVPLSVLGLFVGLVLLGRSLGPKAASRTVAIWASALILWGVARLGVIGLFTWGPVSEAHVQGQFTIWFVLVSLGNVALGVYLFRRRRPSILASSR